MSNIKWEGNQPWDKDYPETPIPKESKKVDMPDDIFKGSIVYGIIPCLLVYLAIYYKWFVLAQFSKNPFYFPLGILIGFLLLPIHEYLHALCFKKGQTVYIGICLEKIAAFAVCHEPIKRSRYIFMSLLPMVLGIIPLLIFLLAPPSALLSGICIPCSFMGLLSPMPDYMNVCQVLKQVPKNAYLHSQNDGLYWYL